MYSRLDERSSKKDRALSAKGIEVIKRQFGISENETDWSLERARLEGQRLAHMHDKSNMQRGDGTAESVRAERVPIADKLGQQRSAQAPQKGPGLSKPAGLTPIKKPE
ncbi:MAG: hypothetical protein LBL84_03015 [Candidatus Nomurabacteria bacterium]|jgi:hypothetical protein|nr:hypothetical protein [Candidatus Nomurabacteria bacterium]